MDFNFKKARNIKRKEDKARSAHHSHPGQKYNTSNQKLKKNPSNEKGGVEANLAIMEEPTLLTETNPVISEQETQDATSLKETKSYSRRSVVSNWERYELPADIPDVEPDGALDFETLINSLSDVKGHLKLSHEQSWGNERSELQEVFFNIDMNQLFINLERVPFHVRHNVLTPLFTSEQLTVFEQDADFALKQSCGLKVTVKEDTLRHKIPEIPTKELDHDNKTIKSLCVSKLEETSDTSIYDNIEKNPPPLDSSDAKSPLFTKIAEITPPAEKLSSIAVPPANSKSDELDLDFLLSLDAAVPDKPNLKEIGALGISGVSDSKPTETEKLDDWLDTLLDD